MEYKVVAEESVPDVEVEVAKLIGEGWVPQGGFMVAVETEFEVSWFYQAMVKDDAPKNWREEMAQAQLKALEKRGI